MDGALDARSWLTIAGVVVAFFLVPFAMLAYDLRRQQRVSRDRTRLPVDEADRATDRATYRDVHATGQIERTHGFALAPATAAQAVSPPRPTDTTLPGGKKEPACGSHHLVGRPPDLRSSSTASSTEQRTPRL